MVFKSISFFHKQLLAVVGTNVLPLIIVSWLLYSNFIDDYKDNLIEVMRSKITLLAVTSQSAILFDDKLAATSLLSSLKQSSAVRYAQIYDVDLNLFAEYNRTGQSLDLPLEDFKKEAFFKNQNVYLSHEIIMGNEKLGVILLSADTNSLISQQQRYVLIASFVFLGSLFLTYILNWRLQKRLTAPISSLIELVRFVATQKKYHKRLNNRWDDEIGDLILGVNTMLDTIEKRERQLYNRANYDDLTKLPNRHLLNERLGHGISVAGRTNSEVALLFMDLDRFKVINDSLGHSIGDELLVHVSRKLVNILRESDSVFRWGGDEFVIVLENIQQISDIDVIIQKIINELCTPSKVGGHLLHISTSIGIARFPHDGRDSQSLLKHADISMYQAKALGPGRYSYFNRAMLDYSVQRLTLETKVHTAFEENQFYLVYQPKMSLDGEHIFGFEALIRWESEGELVSPVNFLPVIEDVGLMGQLSLWVLEQACKQNVSWQKAGFAPTKMAVNFPASFIMQPHCLESIQNILTKTTMSAEFLEIELTENTFLDPTIDAVSVLQSLKNLGLSIAIDDFGTGYSCMSYLQNLPVEVLKIDGSFIKGLGLSQANDGIVQSIVTLGKSLNMVLVGECVETEQQLNILKTMQCDIVQGYFFSKPLDVAAASDFLSNHQNNS